MTKKRKLTKQEQRFYDEWTRTHEEFNAECDALVNKCLLAMRVTAEDKGQILRLLAERYNVEVEVIDISTVDDGPIAWPQVPEEE